MGSQILTLPLGCSPGEDEGGQVLMSRWTGWEETQPRHLGGWTDHCFTQLGRGPFGRGGRGRLRDEEEPETQKTGNPLPVAATTVSSVPGITERRTESRLLLKESPLCAHSHERNRGSRGR